MSAIEKVRMRTVGCRSRLGDLSASEVSEASTVVARPEIIAALSHAGAAGLR